MAGRKTRPKDVAGYVAAAPPAVRARLKALRAAVRAAAPGSTESLKWGMPAVSGRRILVMYAAFKEHIGFFPTPSAVKAFAKPLARYRTGRGSIQFPHDRPLPLPLIRRITAFRVKKSAAKDRRWRTR